MVTPSATALAAALGSLGGAAASDKHLPASTSPVPIWSLQLCTEQQSPGQ